MKKIISAILSLFIVFSFASCLNKNDGLSIYIDGKIENGMQIDYAEEIDFPLAEVRDRNGNTVSFAVTYAVVAKDGKKIVADYPSFSLAPGDYTIEYEYAQAKLKETRSFSVVDRVAPVISFDNVPRNLFLGEKTSGSLPGVDIKEASELKTIESKLYFTGKDGTKKQVEYNLMNETYPITEGGVFEYVVFAEDSSGNKAQNSVSWLIKDAGWVDPSLEEFCVGDFGESDYRNYIRSGDVSPWWNIGDRYSDDWLEEFEGAKGVGKIDLEFTASGHTCVNVKLAVPVTSAMIKGKYLAVKAYVTGDDLHENFGFAGIEKQNFSGEISAAVINKKLKKDEWNTYYLSESELKNIRMYSVKGDKNSDITNVQFCFSKESGGGEMTLYIDSISIAEQLPNVSGLTVTDKKAEWNTVAGAKGYNVTLGNKTFFTEQTTCSVEGEKGIVFVKAVGNGINTLDSDEVQTVYGLNPKTGYVSSFDDELYKYLIVNKVSLGAETAGYTVSNLVIEYKNGKITATFGCGSWGICSAIKVLFPQKITASAGDVINIKMNIATQDKITSFSCRDANYTEDFGYADLKTGETVYSFKVARDMELDGIQLLFITSNGSSISEIKIDFGYISISKTNA